MPAAAESMSCLHALLEEVSGSADRSRTEGEDDGWFARIKEALELSPEYPVAHTYLGRIYLAQAHPLDALSEMETRHPSIGHVRGRGLMVGVELVKDKGTKAPAPQLRNRVIHTCFEHGLLMLGCGRSTIRFMPPLMIQKELVEEGLEIFEHALTEAEQR